MLQRLIALLLLVVYTITGTSIMPAAMAFAAGVDGSHSVYVAQSEQGLRLTLHHSQDSVYTPAVDDHATALARVLVRMCKASEEGDHQMVTAQVDSGTRSSLEDMVRQMKQPAADELVAVLPLFMCVDLPAIEARSTPVPAAVEVARPTMLPQLACVRLLI